METAAFTLLLLLDFLAITSVQGQTTVNTRNDSYSTGSVTLPSSTSSLYPTTLTDTTAPPSITALNNLTAATADSSLTTAVAGWEFSTAANQNTQTMSTPISNNSSKEFNQTDGSSLLETSSQSNVVRNSSSGDGTTQGITSSNTHSNVSQETVTTSSSSNISTYSFTSETPNVSVSESGNFTTPAPLTQTLHFQTDLNVTTAQPTVNATSAFVDSLNSTTARMVNVTTAFYDNLNVTTALSAVNATDTVNSTNVPVLPTNSSTTNFDVNVTTVSYLDNVTSAQLDTSTVFDLNVTVDNVTSMSPLFTGFNVSTQIANQSEVMTTTDNTILNVSVTANISHKMNSSFTFVFDGNCTHFFSNETLEEEFSIKFKEMLAQTLNLNLSFLNTGNITCEPNITINVMILDTFDSDIDALVMDLKMNRSFSVTVRNNTFNLLDILIRSQYNPTEMTTDTLTTTAVELTTTPPLTDSNFRFVFKGNCLILLPDLAIDTTATSAVTSSTAAVNEQPTTSSFTEVTTVSTHNAIITVSDVGSTYNSSSTNVNDTSAFTHESDSSTLHSTVETTAKLTTTTEIPVTTETHVFYEEFANFSTEEQFVKTLKKEILRIVSQFNFTENSIETSNISCGSVVVNLTVFNTTDHPEVDSALNNLPQSNFRIIVQDSMGVRHAYSLEQVSPISSPHMSAVTATKTAHSTTTHSAITTEDGLNETEIIVIIVFGVVGSTLLLFFICYVVYRCCCTRNTKSFTLGDTTNDVRLEDFTLTKMNRPTPIYTDQGIILPPTSTSTSTQGGAAKRTTPYSNPIYQGNNNGQYENFKSSASGSEAGNRQSTENLVAVGGKVHSNPGIENPSFSSDDILDSGSNTSTDLPYDRGVEPTVRS